MKIKNEELFALDSVIMAILLSTAGWLGIEVVGLKTAVAEVKAEQILSKEASQAIIAIDRTLARVEESQRNLKDRVISNGDDIRELTNHVRDLHRK